VLEKFTAATCAGNVGEPFDLRVPPLPQHIYALEHTSLGKLELFLVPIGPDERGMRYQAVFVSNLRRLGPHIAAVRGQSPGRDALPPAAGYVVIAPRVREEL
jgi:hypothetical protein